VPDSSMKKEKGRMGYRKVEGVKLTLAPLATMSGKLSSPVAERVKTPSLAVYALYTAPGAPKPDGSPGDPFEAQALVARVSAFGEFKVNVPAGKFRLISGVEKANGGAEIDFETQNYEHTLELSKPLALGEIKIQLTKLNRLLGQEMPDFSVTEARNTESKKLKDFKGKWVLLEFWGFWCPSCVAGALPDAIDFWEDNKALRDKFTIIAFHDAQARTLVDLDKQLAQRGTSAKYWKNRKIEFPVWLDSTDTAHKSLEIPQYPTAMLIDPEGKLVTANATTKLLGEKLGIVWERKGGNVE
jgi:thiol-disulfide isomerase/thioredoxin